MRLSHIQPAEILHQPDLPKGVLQALEDWKKHRSSLQTDRQTDRQTRRVLVTFLTVCSGMRGLRVEQLPEEWCDYSAAFQIVSQFYSTSSSSNTTTTTTSSSCRAEQEQQQEKEEEEEEGTGESGQVQYKKKYGDGILFSAVFSFSYCQLLDVLSIIPRPASSCQPSSSCYKLFGLSYSLS